MDGDSTLAARDRIKFFYIIESGLLILSTGAFPFDHAQLAMMKASNKRIFISNIHTHRKSTWLSWHLCKVSLGRWTILVTKNRTCSRNWDTVYHSCTAATSISFSCNGGTIIQLYVWAVFLKHICHLRLNTIATIKCLLHVRWYRLSAFLYTLVTTLNLIRIPLKII